MTTSSQLCGWVDDPRTVADIVCRWDTPVVGYGASREFLATEHRDIFAWEQGELPLFGQLLTAHRQTIGDCVSHGWGRAIQDLQFCELARAVADGRLSLEAAKRLALHVATESIYALSRVEVGRGRLGRRDGSIGAWAAEAAIKYGTLLRKKYDGIDLSTYSGQLAKQWGMPGAGLPDALEPSAREYIVRSAPAVTSDDELSAALYNGYWVPVCSNQGFTETRDKYGFCDPSGSWAHCMEFRGICEAKRGSNFVLAVANQQSWGGSPGGPDEIELRSGRKVKLPQGVFLIDFEVAVKRMIKARDSFAPAGPQGLIAREPIFIV